MVSAKQIINSIKPNITKVPTGKTQLGSAGYDNVRDDIEKVKKIREGSIEKVPSADNDITNKKYVDDEIGSYHPHQDVQTTASPSFQGVTLPVTTASNVGVIYKAANRFMHDYKHSTADGGNLFLGESAGNFTMSPGGGSSYLASSNTGIGKEVLDALTTGYHNMGLGWKSLSSNTSGNSNMGIGVQSLFYNTTGNSNCAVGRDALFRNVGGSQNTCIGRDSAQGVSGSSISNNSLVGYRAGYGLTTGGNNNCFFGIWSGYNVTSGEKNILIGYNVHAQSATADYQLSIGNVIFGTGNFGSGTTVGTGNIGIKKTAPACAFDVNGAIASSVKTITSSSDTTDVSGVNTLFADTTSNNIRLGGLVGGVAGQTINIVKIAVGNDLFLEHEEGIGGSTQDFKCHQGIDETLDTGGAVFVNDGTYWWDVSHAKHV